MLRPLIGLCSRTAAGICCQQWHRGVQGPSIRAKGRKLCSKWGYLCHSSGYAQRGKIFFPYRHGVRALAIACSWQGTSSSWLRRRAGNGGWLTAQPSPPFLPATSTGQQISERKKRTKPFIIHSCFSTDSLFAHLDRAENNSMQKEGQEVQAAQVGGLSVPEFGWDHHWAWCGLLWHGSKLVWVLGKDTHYLHFSSNRSEHWYDVI